MCSENPCEQWKVFFIHYDIGLSCAFSGMVFQQWETESTSPWFGLFKKKKNFLNDRNVAKAPFQYLSSLGNRLLHHIDLDFKFCKVLVSLPVSLVKTNVLQTKLLVIRSCLKTSGKIFKQCLKYSPHPNETGRGKAKIIRGWGHVQISKELY